MKKKRILLLFVITMIVAGMVSAQSYTDRQKNTWRIVPKVGGTMTRPFKKLVKDDFSMSPTIVDKLGYTLGVDAEYWLRNTMNLSFGLSYVLERYDGKVHSYYWNGRGGTYGYLTSIKSLRLPIMANYYFAKSYFAGIGIEPWYVLNHKKSIGEISDVKNFFVAIPIAIGFDAGELQLELTYHITTQKVGGVSNNTLMLTAGLPINL